MATATTPFRRTKKPSDAMAPNPNQANAADIADPEVDANDAEAEEAVEERRAADEERHQEAKENANPDNYRDDEPWD